MPEEDKKSDVNKDKPDGDSSKPEGKQESGRTLADGSDPEKKTVPYDRFLKVQNRYSPPLNTRSQYHSGRQELW